MLYYSGNCFRAREAGCFREVAALHSDHLRQVPLDMSCTYEGRLN